MSVGAGRSVGVAGAEVGGGSAVVFGLAVAAAGLGVADLSGASVGTLLRGV